MGITADWDYGAQRVRALATGSVTLADVRTHLEQERAAGGLPWRELIDARGAKPDLSSEDVREIVRIMRRLASESLLGPTAVVVNSDFGFGVLRMLEMLVDDVGAVRPFRQYAEAEAWLETA